MSYNSTSAFSNDPRAETLRTDFRAKTNRFFVGFAVAEAAVLGIAILAIYVFKIIEPEIGIWLIVGIALVSGLVLSMTLIVRMRTYQRELSDISGR